MHIDLFCKFVFPIICTSSHKTDALAPVAQLVECPRWGTGGHGFDPGPRHTKIVKMVLAAFRLTGTQTYGVELGLIDPVSG